MKQVISSEIKKAFFDKLDERQKRRYAAIEALSLGYGGQSAVHRVLGISISALRRGISDVKQGDSVPADRIRKPGGGRKKTPEGSIIREKLKSVVSDYEAGIPTDYQVRRVSLSPAKIQRKMESGGG